MPEFQILGDVTIAGSRIIVPVAIATVISGVVVPVSGTLSATIAGTVVAEVNGGTVQVASVMSPVALAGGTVGTVQSTANMAVASLVGSIGSPVVIGGGTVTELAASYAFTNVSATVKGSAGVLYGISVAGEKGLVAGAGTLLALDGTATIIEVPVAAGGFQSVPLLPGVGFSNLIASIIGSVQATFVVR